MIIITMSSFFPMDTIPPWYDATKLETTKCRIFHTALSQGHCNACTAFSVSTAWSMRMCLRHGVDFIPSPYRMYDCVAASCDTGSSIYRMAHLLARTDNNITDISASPRQYGLGCPTEDPARRGGTIMRTLENPMEIKEAILKWGPLPAAVDFSDADRYWFGVFHPGVLPKPMHSVVVIGWGSTPENYWLIQNSWGGHWGVSGRGMLAERSLKYVAVEMDESYLIPFLTLWILVPLFTVAMIVQHRTEDDYN